MIPPSFTSRIKTRAIITLTKQAQIVGISGQADDKHAGIAPEGDWAEMDAFDSMVIEGWKRMGYMIPSRQSSAEQLDDLRGHIDKLTEKFKNISPR